VARHARRGLSSERNRRIDSEPVLFRRERPYDRTEVLGAADRARARGRLRKAIAGYRRVLAADPDDAAVHAKLAPLLARRGEAAGALQSFRAAAQGQLEAGFPDRALAVYVRASGFFPGEAPLWEAIARLHLGRGRRASAVQALLEGGRTLSRTVRPKAIGLLRQALELEPRHLECTLALAGILPGYGGRDEALDLLRRLAPEVAGRARRRVRRAIFRISPTPGNLWRWLRAR